jgi:hypothetical protein
VFKRIPYDRLFNFVQGNSNSQDVVADQQHEIIRYLGGLNTWLERDVIDRQFELRALTERMDQLRDELLNRLGRPSTPLMYQRMCFNRLLYDLTKCWP